MGKSSALTSIEKSTEVPLVDCGTTGGESWSKQFWAIDTQLVLSREGTPVIDRLAPSRRPLQRAVMRQKWRDLLFVHWPVSVDVLRPLVPAELELDLFDGTAYVGLVPFTMTGVRPVGLPAVAGLSTFHETNVRTYVRLADRDPGVWFFSLEAANAIAVHLARRLFHLPYHFARMFLEHEPATGSPEPATILYAGTRRWPGPLPASYAVRARPVGPANRRRRELSSTFSSNVTSCSRSMTIVFTRAAFTIAPILCKAQKSSHWTRRCWRPPGSKGRTSHPSLTSPPGSTWRSSH